MIGLGVKNRSFRRRPLRTVAERVTVALAIAILLAAGAFARSFEPFSQDQAEKAANPPGKWQDPTLIRANRSPEGRRPHQNQECQAGLRLRNDLATSSRSKDERAKRNPETSVPIGVAADPDVGRARPARGPVPDQEQPQGRAGDVDDRRRIRPPDLFRPDRPAAHASAGAIVSAGSFQGQARSTDRHVAGQPEYARNWAKYWRDVIKFHSTSENPNQVRFDALEDWLAKRLQANTPWDEIVTGNDHGHRPQRRERGRRVPPGL